jgi:hypothetical protein
MSKEIYKLINLKKTNKSNIKKIIESIDFDDVNFNLIKKNAKFLYEHGQKIKKIWNTLSNDYNKIRIQKTEEYDKIMNIIKNNQLKECDGFYEYLKKNNKLTKYNDTEHDVTYYVLKDDLDKNDDDIIINQMKITISLKKHFKNKFKTIIIWIPIEAGRDFMDNIVNNETLSNSKANFNAFTASGLTYGDIKSDRITIVTRYEEVDKLLIHELFHNFGIDGSLKKTEKFNKLNDKYKTIKNSLENNGTKNFDYKYSIYESYAELSSSYFSLIFKNLNKERMYENLIVNIFVELLYSYNTIYNLAKINGYINYEEFINKKVFKGKICFFEYYYLKALMYNNYEYQMNDDIYDLYKDVVELSNKNDPLLEQIFDEKIKQNNFKFCYY